MFFPLVNSLCSSLPTRYALLLPLLFCTLCSFYYAATLVLVLHVFYSLRSGIMFSGRYFLFSHFVPSIFLAHTLRFALVGSCSYFWASLGFYLCHLRLRSLRSLACSAYFRTILFYRFATSTLRYSLFLLCRYAIFYVPIR